MQTLNEIVFFAFVSLLLAYISRKSLRVPGSHGFYRFFAWETILALLITNIGKWFFNPFSLRQIISWILLFISIFYLIIGSKLLFTTGKPSRKRKDDTLFTFEKTTSLVTTGIYKYIRHPLYGSMLFLTWGIYFKNAESVAAVVLSITATLFLVATGKADEKECVQFFGEEYQHYMKRTKMFLPFVF